MATRSVPPITFLDEEFPRGGTNTAHVHPVTIRESIPTLSKCHATAEQHHILEYLPDSEQILIGEEEVRNEAHKVPNEKQQLSSYTMRRPSNSRA